MYVLHEIGWKGGVWCQIYELVDTGHLSSVLGKRLCSEIAIAKSQVISANGGTICQR